MWIRAIVSICLVCIQDTSYSQWMCVTNILEHLFIKVQPRLRSSRIHVYIQENLSMKHIFMCWYKNAHLSRSKPTLFDALVHAWRFGNYCFYLCICCCPRKIHRYTFQTKINIKEDQFYYFRQSLLTLSWKLILGRQIYEMITYRARPSRSLL